VKKKIVKVDPFSAEILEKTKDLYFSDTKQNKILEF
jgi:hypothetical protein